MCYVGTVMPQIFIASKDVNFLSIAQDCFFVRVYMGRDGLYRMREVSFGISFSREGSLVPGKEIVKPLFCSIHTASGQGLLYSSFYATILPPDSVAFALEVVAIYSLQDKYCEVFFAIP
jgi:hypothetical protein